MTSDSPDNHALLLARLLFGTAIDSQSVLLASLLPRGNQEQQQTAHMIAIRRLRWPISWRISWPRAGEDEVEMEEIKNQERQPLHRITRETPSQTGVDSRLACARMEIEADRPASFTIMMLVTIAGLVILTSWPGLPHIRTTLLIYLMTACLAISIHQTQREHEERQRSSELRRQERT